MKFQLLTIFLLALNNSNVEAVCPGILLETLRQCLKPVESNINACKQDQACLCKAYYYSLECYNNCINDEEVAGKRSIAESSVTIHCGAAKINTKELTPTATPISGKEDTAKETGDSKDKKDDEKNKKDSKDSKNTSGSNIVGFSTVGALSAISFSALWL